MNLDLNTLAMLAGMMGGKNTNFSEGGAAGQNGAMLETLMKLVSGMNGSAAGGSGANASMGGAGGLLSVLPMLMSVLGGKGAEKQPPDSAKGSGQNCEVNKAAEPEEQFEGGNINHDNGAYESRNDSGATRRQPENNYSKYTTRNRFCDIDFAGAEVEYIMAKLLRTAKYGKH